MIYEREHIQIEKEDVKKTYTQRCEKKNAED